MPVAVPLVIRPALVLGAVSAHADRGLGVVAAALAGRGGGPGGRHRGADPDRRARARGAALGGVARWAAALTRRRCWRPAGVLLG